MVNCCATYTMFAGILSTLCSRASRAALLIMVIGLLTSADISDGARPKRAVMVDMQKSVACISGTITERNSTTSIVLTGTAKKCDKMRPGKYSCSIQVWRIMKGRKIAWDLVEVHQETLMKTRYTKSYVEIRGFGNVAFCDSQVKEDKTRIFFLNRVDDRLVLAASLLHITLRNLENTEKVIKGEKIAEVSKKKQDPCLFVLCGFGAKCEASSNGIATCMCPKVTCGKSPESSDKFAPVCGSDGVTYPSKCRLKAAECWSQRRIRIISKLPCSPVQKTDPCNGVRCGNSAKCVVENGLGKCQCLSCDDVITKPVCGSDQKTYRSECDLRRVACMNVHALQVVRRSTCDPCQVYNGAAKMFESTCSGICTLDKDDNPVCCDSIPCETTEEMMVCGSDGRTYMSKCALLRHICKTGRNVTEVSVGVCPSPRETTVIRGSVSIQAGDKCPGNCDESSPEFIAFIKAFEGEVNQNLGEKNKADIDAKSLMNFKVEEVHKGSAVLVYSAVASWFDKPIGEDFIPDEDTLWALHRLHDPAQGVLKEAIESLDVTFVSYKNPLDDFVVEEVCGSTQCSHSASCLLSKDVSGGFLYACDCSIIGDADLLAVTLGCKLANNNRFYDNKIAARRASCATQSFLTFRDICRDPPANPCDDLKCDMDGRMCIITDGKASCECVTCSEEFQPVCGSNDKTYRSTCELSRENCLRGTSVTVKSHGMCASQCDEVDCRNGGQCEELSQGTAHCICPSACVEVYAPVCGSDGLTYENDCEMTIVSCKKKSHVIVLKRQPCDGTEKIIQPTEIPEVGSGEGSSDFEVDECGCHFGATCGATIDDEDARCVCDISCNSSIESTLCGSDGMTYMNECELAKAQCDKQHLITVVSYGKCPDHCSKSVFGCCADGITPAKGGRNAGCQETCQCNKFGSFSPFCNHTTGQCVCRPGVGGRKCDQCQPGFWNFRAVIEHRSIGCMDCRCEKGGSVRDDCDQMTGQCTCKDGIAGVKCSRCEAGNWVTPGGCVEADGEETALSCEELNCQFGQECVEVVGRHICKCPSLSSCDTYLNGKVCASNGITYADECQMKVVACRESKVITVLAEGSCDSYFESLQPVIPPTGLASTTMSTTIASTTTTIFTTSNTAAVSSTPETVTLANKPMVTKMTEHPTMSTGVEEEELEGSGSTTLGEGPLDDEDRETGMESSGEATDHTTPTEHPFPDGLLTPESLVAHRVEATLMSAGTSSDLAYSIDLESRDSEVFVEYSTNIKNRIANIIVRLPKPGAVMLNSMRDVDMSPSAGDGVSVTFLMDVSMESSIPWLEDFINKNLEDGESFKFVEPVVRPVEPPLTNFTYVEDGKWTVPQFGGSSYMEFNRMEAYSAATIHMKFKSADSEGLLLYNGQGQGKDFISLAIIGGYVEFRFDTGSGQLSLRSTVQVNDGKWHEVVSRRNRREGMLKVDNEDEVAGTSLSRTTSVNLDTSLFIGGMTDLIEDTVFKQTGVSRGLTGCISEVMVGEHGTRALYLSSGEKEVINTFRIAECTQSPCLPNPCLYRSKCFITYQLEEFTYKCNCGAKYYGDRCQHRTMKDTCASNPCHDSSTCVEDEDSYRCICPDSRAGIHCESLIADLPLPSTMEPSYMPMFAGDSYIQRPSLSGVSTQLDIEIKFYTYQNEGLLFYNAHSDSGKGDFIALKLKNGHLEFMYDLGEGVAILRSQAKVSLNEWHVAKLSRVMRIGDLRLDDGPIIKGESPHQHSQLNLGQPLYIGFVPEGVTLPQKVGKMTGLMGAIQKFVVNNVMLPRSLIDDDSTSYHVQAFNGHACYRQPCLHDGVCVPSLGNFSCQCKPGYFGRTCMEANEETEGFTMLQDPLQQAVLFDGNVKAQYKNFITRRVNSFKSNHFEVQFKTNGHHGLLFYDGKPSKRGDYIALALNHGFLHFVFDLGSGPMNIVSDILVNDGLWRSVKIVRNEHRASLQVDDRQPKLASAPPFTKWLNTEGFLWLGGCGAEHMPPRHRGLPKSFYAGFQGCIRQFQIDGNRLQLRDDVLNRPGLSTCQDR